MSAEKKPVDATAVLKKLNRSASFRIAKEKARLAASIAEQVFRLRIASGLTQAQLAKKTRTAQSVISRLEDGDYTGYSLTTICRIAQALGVTVEISFPTPHKI